MRGAMAIVGRDDLLADLGDLADGLVQEVERRFLIAKEAGVEYPRAFMAAVGRYDRETTRERRRASRSNVAERHANAAVEPAAPLHQETAVPVLWHRQRETD